MGEARQEPGHLEQGKTNIFYKGPHGKHFRLYGPHNLCCNSSTHNSYMNGCGCIQLNSIYKKTSGGVLIWPKRSSMSALDLNS